MTDAITGVTFPVPKKFMPRFFSGGKTVFIKPATVFKELKRGMKLVFYQSHEDTGFAGEARIKRIIIFDNPMQFFDTYGDAVFLTPEEVKEYLAEQEKQRSAGAPKGESRKKPWIALELEEIREYDGIVKTDRFVPAGGKYLRN